MSTWGVDVSRFQGLPDWTRVRASGVTVAQVNVDQGNEHRDEQLAGARAAGLTAGAYAYCGSWDTGQAVADRLLGHYQAGDLAVCLDLEDASLTPGKVAELVEAVRARAGHEPVLYANRGDYDRLGLARWPQCPLWLAGYPHDDGSGRPHTWQPDPGDQPGSQPRALAGWQFTGQGTVPGVDAATDRTLWYSPPIPAPTVQEDIVASLADLETLLDQRLPSLRNDILTAVAADLQPVQASADAAVHAARRSGGLVYVQEVAVAGDPDQNADGVDDRVWLVDLVAGTRCHVSGGVEAATIDWAAVMRVPRRQLAQWRDLDATPVTA